MKKNRFTEEKMVAILREADKARFSQPRVGIGQYLVSTSIPDRPGQSQPCFVLWGLRVPFIELREKRFRQ